MDGGVQVVDQLRANGGLCENQLNRGERVECVAVQHRKECLVSLGRLKAFSAGAGGPAESAVLPAMKGSKQEQ